MRYSSWAWGIIAAELPPDRAERWVADGSPPTQVELLVMKALSVGLVRGSIDEVDKRVHMTWVQPRVLDLQQVKPLSPWFAFVGLGCVCCLFLCGRKPLRKKASLDM